VLRNVSVNEFFHQRNLASPDNGGVFTPNVDTLYSRVVLDLSTQDVELTIPYIGDDRYWNYPVYDAWSNELANIGIVNDNKPGKYLIRRAADVGDPVGFDNSSSTLKNSCYKGFVNLPGSYGTMLVRLEVITNSTTELNTLRGFQNASSLTPVDRNPIYNTDNPAPSFKSLALNGSFLGIRSPAQQLSFASRVVPYNQPLIYSDRYRVATILSRAGLFNNQYEAPSGVNLTQAAVIANRSITADVNNPNNTRYQGNEYYLLKEAYAGVYGKNYAAQAYVQLSAPQLQVAAQTLYPGYRSVGFNSFYPIPANGSWLFTFSAKPKTKKNGFWSLSVYGGDGNLVRNSLNRFSVSDRTYNLTYRDGSYVYGPRANASQDGPFDVLLQRKGNLPPANWTGNWLPSEDSFYMLCEYSARPIVAFPNED
jgi:uncharacterized membrane protein